MAVTPTYPGVYVQEVPSGVRTIAGVSTSTALFMGAAAAGPMNEATLCTSYSEFRDAFGEDATKGDLPHYVRLFFLNGGSRCYVMRLANGYTHATVALLNEDGDEVLTLTARSPGLVGEAIRAAVTYKGAQPEVGFNIELFTLDAKGNRAQVEQFANLSMDPGSSAYAPTVLTQSSKLVTAEASGIATLGSAAPGPGVSRSGRSVAFDASNAADSTSFMAAWGGLLGTLSTTGNQFQISVGGSSYGLVKLGTVDVAGAAGATIAATETALAGLIRDRIHAALPAGTTVAVSFVAGPTPEAGTGTQTRQLVITAGADGQNVLIRPAPTDDAAAKLMLGTAQGGVEIGAYTEWRPAPTGFVTRVDQALLAAFGGRLVTDITEVTLDTASLPVDLATAGTATQRIWQGSTPAAVHGNSDGLREKLGLLRDAINAQAAKDRSFGWTAELWGSRLAITRTQGEALTAVTLFDTAPVAADTAFGSADWAVDNVRWYAVGTAGTAGLQTPAATPAFDGDPPALTDYTAAYEAADTQVDLFNLLVLPPNADSPFDQQDLWADASAFCAARRAFLLMDPPADWASAQDALDNVSALRVGLVNDHAALYFPRIQVNDRGLKREIGPAGAIAGLYARVDGTRGVWKAPAGTEATLRGVTGVSLRLTDQQNGVVNPAAVNAIRVFPSGVVAWGARTMDGDDTFASEYKYVPIRRLALYIEESLYRGLKWAVFEPNDEPLWAQIRLNVGAFMNNLFRQGAFQGATPKDAYFVKCDAETTTQNDRNLGVVNVWVGFAPLKPAEFVVLYLQQVAGAVQT